MEIKGYTCEHGNGKILNGRNVNEDILVIFSTQYNNTDYDFIILMDGATGLGKEHQILDGYTFAEWYVRYITNNIQIILMQKPTYDLKSVVENSILKAIDEINIYEMNNNITLKEYQKPSASLSLLRNNGKTTEVYLLGDTQTIVAYKNGIITTVNNQNQKSLQKLDNKILSRMIELAKEKKCNVIDTRTDTEIEKMLQIHRSKKNRDSKDGYWVCGTNKEAAQHGICINFNNDEISDLVLASDGFDFSILNFNEEQVYKIIKNKGIKEVSNLIRKQQNEDCMCNKFPRFKITDDLTVIHLEF